MKRSTAYIIIAAAVIVTGAYLVVSLGMASRRSAELRCTGIDVTVSDSSRHSFITSNDVKTLIYREYGSCVGKPVQEIDLTRIEEIIQERNAVLDAEAYFTSNGRLNVKVVQRTPVLRFKNSEEDFFTDRDGYIFHMQTGRTANVTTVTGRIPVRIGTDFQGELQDTAAEAWIRDMIVMSRYLGRSGLWGDVAVSVRENGDIVFKPDGEKLTVVFGRPDNFQSKFSRIRRYYSTIVPEVGEDKYSTVSVKFAGQIVCHR